MAVERTVAFDGARGIGRGHAFSAEDAGHANLLALARRTVLLAQTLAKLRQQRVARDERKVVDVALVPLPLAACRTHCDERRTRCTRPRRHGQLGLYLVAGIDDRRG